MSKLQWRVKRSEEGLKLVAFLADKLGFSARFVKKAIDSYHVKLNGRCERFATTRLKEGDRVRFDLSRENVSLAKVLYEDDYCVIYDKPPGISCQKESLPEGFVPVHRLDKNTSGCWLVAKKEEKLFNEVFRSRKIQKKYLAIVDGVPEKSEGKIVGYLGRISQEGQVRWGLVSPQKGQYSVTEWSLVRAGRSMALLSCRLITGRTHQIRVHLSSIGLPIVGDWQYHDHFRCGFDAPRPLLHAYTLDFLHPITGDEVQVTAPMPEDFVRALANI